MLDFTQDLMRSWMNLLPASPNQRKWCKMGRKQTVAQKRRSTLSSPKG